MSPSFGEKGNAANRLSKHDWAVKFLTEPALAKASAVSETAEIPNIYYNCRAVRGIAPRTATFISEVVPLKSNQRNTHSKSIGTSLSRALVMITVTVINVFSRNKK